VEEATECEEGDLECEEVKEECAEGDTECQAEAEIAALTFEGWVAPNFKELLKEGEEPEILEMEFMTSDNLGVASFEFSELVVSHSNFTVV